MITNSKLPDMQKCEVGFVKRKIEKVGVRGIKLPLQIKSKNGKNQTVSATISSYCNLVEDVKGINMSRISRTIMSNLGNGIDGISDLSMFAEKLKEAHQTDNIYIKAKFQYLIEGRSPMSEQPSIEPVDVVFETTLENGEQKRYLTVIHTGMSLCPCSKEMSMLYNNVTEDEMEEILKLPISLKTKILGAGFGAHNQNSIVNIKVELKNGNKLWIEDIVDIINKSVSSPVFNTLKREDEKYVTELSYLGGYYNDDKEFVDVGYGGAKFVEDIVRSCANKLDEYIDYSISDFVVVVDNAESIHPEDIYATAVSSAGRNLK